MGVEWMFPPHTGKHVRTDPPLVPQRKAEPAITPSVLRRLIRMEVWGARNTPAREDRAAGSQSAPAAGQTEGTRT
jgi:hypothetical protein